LNNAGDVLTLRDSQGATVAVFDINGLSGNPDEAYSRNPDVTGAFVRHSAIPAANGALFSPGMKVNGSNF
jgi:ankyrin repeat protein